MQVNVATEDVVQHPMHGLEHHDGEAELGRPEQHQPPTGLDDAVEFVEHAADLVTDEMFHDAKVVKAVERRVVERPTHHCSRRGHNALVTAPMKSFSRF